MTTPPPPPDEESVEKVALQDALGRSGLFTGTVRVVGDGDGDDDEYHPIHGTMDYDSTDAHAIVQQYVGRWSSHDNHWEDRNGRITYTTGDVYHGSVERSVKQGAGVYEWKTDGRSYAGRYEQDVRHGQGTYRWPDGSSYTGQFVRNQREGFGTFTAEGGISYVGHWKQGVYHGEGTYQYPDKHTGEAVVYTGEFAQGVPNGIGKETTRGGKVVRHDGLWKDGQPVRRDHPEQQQSLDVVLDQPWFDPVSHLPAVYRGLWNSKRQPEGNGTAVYQKGPIVEYEGCWKNGRYHGQGRIVYQTGEVYSGLLEDSKRHGTGTFQWKDGRQYTGDWAENVRTGAGVFTWPSGDRYEGEFENGQRSGTGMFVFGESGAYYSGEWKKGVYEGKGKMVDASGACYNGEFKQGQRHGTGEEYDSSGNIRMSGTWEHGEYQTHDALLRKKSFDTPAPVEDATIAHVDLQECEGSSATEPEPQMTGTEAQEENHELNEAAEAAAQEDIPAPPSAPPPPVPGQTLLRGWDQRNDSTRTRGAIPGEEEDCVAVVDKHVVDGLGCAGLYTGLVLKGQPHGVGRLVYEDGKRIHEGFWVHGSKEGHGRCLFTPQQDFHEGEYKGNLRHGPGRYTVRGSNLASVFLLTPCFSTVVDGRSAVCWRLQG